MGRKLTPPPRVVPRDAAGAGASGGVTGGAGGIGIKTIAAFLILGAAAVSVFVVLPGYVAPPSTTVEGGAGPGPEETPTAGLAPQTPEREPDPEITAPPRPEPEPEPEPERRPAPSPPPEPEPEPAPVDTTEAEFTRAMSEGMTALNAQDFPKAKEAFERARGLKPESGEAEDALAQADERIRLAAIAGHRERATAFESDEAWRDAESEYDRALALDPNLRFAREGKERTQARKELAEALAFHIGHPERLSDAAVLDEVVSVLRKAEAVVAEADTRHAGQVRELRELIDAYSRVVPVTIRSDGLTEVTVYRVGRLGVFEARSLELRPGRYTAIGSRDGYRDVRRELVIEPGKTPEPLVVVCEEPIR